MAKQARSYASLALTEEDPQRKTGETQRAHIERVVAHRKNSLGRPKRDGLGDDGKTVKQKAHQWLTYLSPEAVLAMKRYALDAGMKPMDCAVEAFEMWFASKGINVPVRVRSENYGGGE